MGFLDFDFGGMTNPLGGFKSPAIGVGSMPKGLSGGQQGQQQQKIGQPPPQIPNAGAQQQGKGQQQGLGQPAPQIPNAVGQGGSSVGSSMNKPMMGDLQQSPLKGQQQGRMSFMDTLAKIESSGGTNTRNLISASHVGKYQMNPAAFKRFGSGDINDPTAQAAAAQNMANYNRTSLKQLTGRDPSDAEVYLSYNQGLHGAWQLLSNPDKPAGSLVKPQNIMNQGGDPRAPASNFINMITQKWNDAAGGAQTMGATRGVNPDPYAEPAHRFTNSAMDLYGSTDQLNRNVQEDEAAAAALRRPPVGVGLERQ